MGDAFASGIGFLLKQIALLALAILAGTVIAALALLAGKLADPGRFSIESFRALLGSPLSLFLSWILPNVFFVGIATFCLIRTGTNPFISWGILVSLEAIIVITGKVGRVGGWLPVTAAWTTCAVFLAMLGTALWFLRQWRLNHWAGELAMLKSENEMRRAELEGMSGINSLGSDGPGSD